MITAEEARAVVELRPRNDPRFGDNFSLASGCRDAMVPTPHTLRARPIRARLVVAPVETAQRAIGPLEPGCRIIGMTKGQFSLLDLLRAVLEQTGPAHVTVSTWTPGLNEVENVYLLKRAGALLSIRLLVDRSFPSRQPQYCRRVKEVFGEEAIRCASTHAKFLLVRNDAWNIVVRTSMNFNRNPRFEQFDLDDDPAICAFFAAHVDEIETLMPAGLHGRRAVTDPVFERALGGGLSDAYPLEDEPKQDLDALLARLSAEVAA